MTTHRFLRKLENLDTTLRTGRVVSVTPTHIRSDGPAVPLGAICAFETTSSEVAGGLKALAEVVGIGRDSITLSPLDYGSPTFSGARVRACGDIDTLPVGDSLLGRLVDPLARPLDGGGQVGSGERGPLKGQPLAPLERASPRMVLETGIRAIDGVLTMGLGQRVGVFAASGVGKTTLMSQLASQVHVDRCVICLVGERGREVETLWTEGLDARAKAKTVMVAATSDDAAALRARAGDYALAIAEHWRAKGHHVVLLLDSVTRLAMALREIGLAAGEPPTVRAYTPNVFAAIPRLVERCGAAKAGGSITAVMTVLSETDDVDDPISEMMKSLLDGHIILSRSLAEKSHFPAIDIPRSVSRLASRVVDHQQHEAAARLVAQLGTYEASKTLIETGIYTAGSSADIDTALTYRPRIMAYLKQPASEHVRFAAARAGLIGLFGPSA